MQRRATVMVGQVRVGAGSQQASHCVKLRRAADNR